MAERIQRGERAKGNREFWGYVWLLVVCLFFLLRCLIDLTLVRRPALGANLNLSGLAWLAGALFVITWSLSRATWPEAKAALPTVLAALGVTAVVAGAILAYPLYMHFAGPQTFAGTGFSQRHFAEDVIAYLSFSDRSLAGWAGLSGGWLAPDSVVVVERAAKSPPVGWPEGLVADRSRRYGDTVLRYGLWYGRRP